jgi:hypothetical protein
MFKTFWGENPRIPRLSGEEERKGMGKEMERETRGSERKGKEGDGRAIIVSGNFCLTTWQPKVGDMFRIPPPKTLNRLSDLYHTEDPLACIVANDWFAYRGPAEQRNDKLAASFTSCDHRHAVLYTSASWRATVSRLKALIKACACMQCV